MDSNTPTVTQVSLTKYITHKDSPGQQIEQPSKKDSKKCKKNSGENPPDKRHHESEDKQETMIVNPQNNEMINTQNKPSHDVPETNVNTEKLQQQLSAMEQ